jgi:hypothetical protein
MPLRLFRKHKQPEPAGRPSARVRLTLEPLEDRTLLSTITWIAGSGNFDVGSNWSGGVVPGPNDVAVIDTGSTAATITIQNGDNIQVQAINTANADTLAFTGVFQDSSLVGPSFAGGALTVTAGSSTLNGPLSIAAGSLTATGSGVSFTANGTTTFSNGSIGASNGAQLSLPALTGIGTSTAVSLSAAGSDSVLSVPALTTINGGNSWSHMGFVHALYSTLSATNGGTVLDGALTSLNGVYLPLNGTGTLAISQWTAFTDGQAVISGGTYTFPNLATIDGSEFLASGGAYVSLPTVTSFTGSGPGDGGFSADGTGSTINVPALTTFNGRSGYDMHFPSDVLSVTQGGTVVFGAPINLSFVNTQFDTTSTLGITIQGASAGSNGPLSGTSGPIDLAGIHLQLYHTAATPVGSVFAIVNSTGAISGTFAGLPEGAVVNASDGTQFSISYQANGGTTITLTQLATIGPTITGFSPTAGGAGTVVTITGTEFTGATAVAFGGVAATAFTVNSDTQITATVPTGTATGPIIVDTPSGTAFSTTSFVDAPPTITGFSPSGSPVGTVVTIHGTNFSGVTAVSFNGVASNFTVTAPTQITATVPSGATTGSITVTNPYGSATSAATFTVGPLPTITGFSPGSGPVGSQVVITGTNFSDVSDVEFNAGGARSTFVINSPTQITATVPNGAFTDPIAIYTPVGIVTSAASFTVTTSQSPPTITSFSPASAAPGATVTVTGTNFIDVVNVTFNGVLTTNFHVNSPTNLTVVVPVLESTGGATGPIGVNALGGFGQSSTIFTQATRPSDILVTAPDAGGGPQVNVYNADIHTLVSSFFAYDASFTGGVRVAVGDVNGDGIPDIITGAGPGGGSDIKIFDQSGNLIREFSPFNPLFTGSQYIAAADLNHQGHDDIIVGADYGGGPNVIVFDGKTGVVLYNFFAYDPAFIGGVRVAAGDVLGNGQMDIICGAGPGGGPNVTVFQPNADGTVTPINSFFAYNPAFTLGIYVAAGDVQGNGKDAIITGAGAGGGPNVSVFDGSDGSLISSFFAYDPAFVGGVRVAAVQKGDGSVAVVTVTGPGGGPQENEFDGMSGAMLDSFFAYNPLFNAGLWVGGA